ELEQRLTNAEQTQEPAAEDFSERQVTMAAAEAARGTEIEARLAGRTPEESVNGVRGRGGWVRRGRAEERVNAVRGRADALRRAAAAEREARVRAQRAREARRHAAAIADAVAESGHLVALRLAEAIG